MTLSPLTNVFAYSDPDESVLNAVRARLEAAAEFTTVWEPAPSWVAATAPLGGGNIDSEPANQAGLAFGEGAHLAGKPQAVAVAVDAGQFDLGGDVGLVRFRIGGGASVVRSAAGLVPWYVWSGGRSAAVATRITDLVRFLPGSLEVDPLPCALWASLQCVFPDRRTFIVGVDAVAPGTAVILQAERSARHVAWWDPWRQHIEWPSMVQRHDHVAEFREAILAALRAGLDPNGRNLLTLSGGVDSTLLAAVIAGHLKIPISALSFVPDGNETSSEHEWAYLGPIVEEFVTPPHIARPLGMAAGFELAGRGPVVAFPILHPALQVLPEVAAETGARVLVGGEFADEVCGGYFVIPDWLDVVGPGRLLGLLGKGLLSKREIRSWVGRPILRWIGQPRPPVYSPEGLADFVRPELDAEYKAWRSDRLAHLAGDDRPYRHLRSLLVTLEGATAMNWEACSALGVRRLFPFLTRQTLELVAACHPAELIGPGTKRLERQAFAGLVPAHNLGRADKGSFGATRGDGETAHLPPPPALLAGVVRDEIVENGAELSSATASGLRCLVGFAENWVSLRPDGRTEL